MYVLFLTLGVLRPFNLYSTALHMSTFNTFKRIIWARANPTFRVIKIPYLSLSVQNKKIDPNCYKR